VAGLLQVDCRLQEQELVAGDRLGWRKMLKSTEVRT
jgi:hypothetical protein